jgi:phosphatidylglycerol:prolipoprotein diacylglycerol transferase
VGIFVGQILGRMGNFFNKEAFGGYSDGWFAMAIKRSEMKYVPQVLKDKVSLVNGVEYIQVHPMFLYEIVWNILAMTFVLFYFKKRRFNGETS